MTVIVAIAAAVVLLVVLEYLPVGRQLLAVGANRRAAELTGIGADLRIVFAFLAGGLIVGVGGALYGANLGAASNATGPTLLLPAFAGAFLGSTAIVPGASTSSVPWSRSFCSRSPSPETEQVGSRPWIEAVVEGGALIAAVAFSSWAIRLRTARLRDAQLALLEAERDDEALVPFSEATDGSAA